MKKLALMALVAAFSACVQASELWWTLAETVEIDGTETQWATARVFASTDGSNFGGTGLGGEWSYSEISEWGYAHTDLGSDASTKSFYIELYNSDQTRIGATYVSTATSGGKNQGATSYSELAQAGAIYEGGMSMANVTAYEVSSTQFTTAEVVPEPTSGLLLLIGFAGLALRRRRT